MSGRNDATFDLELAGCRPEPLAAYLKALAVLRLVAEQVDHDARGYWRGEHFVLRSRLDRAALVEFFATSWRPTPIVAPWNGGSGFYPKDNREAAEAILASTDPRLAEFSSAIRVARAYVADEELLERPVDERKTTMVAAMRATLPDSALAWLDAAVVLGDDRLLFPPLLGTGGNDGRLDFSNNAQQRVVEVLTANHRSALEAALFDDVVPLRFKGAMGQFQPAANERSNPWDFVLLIEGALMFAGAATRRLESSSSAMLAFPFHAKSASGLSTLTDGDEAESRNEVWLPLWSSASSLMAVRKLFAEGRATVGTGDASRPASTGLDFARAVAALGVDRGIEAFSRIGFQVRNGLAYFATPLGRHPTREVPAARMLDEIDAWYVRFRQRSLSKTAPERVAIARRRLELAMFDAATRGELGATLLALGDVERALAQSLSFATKSFLTPVPRLTAAWASETNDGSCEWRLAAALANRPRLRGRWISLNDSERGFGRVDDPSRVFAHIDLVENLLALLRREDIEQLQQATAPDGRRAAAVARERRSSPCSLTDIARFISGDVDDSLIDRWLRGLALVEDPDFAIAPVDTVAPPATFAVLALVHHRHIGSDAEFVPRTPSALRLACAGDSAGATAAAIRRLAALGRPMPDRLFLEPAARTRRIAAALAFSLTTTQRRRLEAMVLPAAAHDARPTR
jgi:CRISPR-associated protein Csx17